MANGQPVLQGGSNICTAPTALAATTITGGNKQTFNAFASPGGVGLYGTALPIGTSLYGPDTGVAGRAYSTGVFGQAEAGVQDTGGGRIATGAGVAGVAPNGGAGVHGSATDGFGVLGQDAGGVGVQGVSVGGAGVAGRSESGVGVAGESAASIGVTGNGQTAQGVFGTSVSSAGTVGLSTSGTGVRGRSTRGVGTIGESTESIGVFGSGRAQPGVRGDSNSSQGVLGMSGSGFGVQGWSENGPAGVLGFSAARVGVRGVSTSGYGMVAVSATGVGLLAAQTGNVAAAAGAVIGMAETGLGVGALSRTGIALYAKSNTNLAARFDGGVQVHGSFQVIGGTKAAVVPHRDGTHRQLYCVESPESWFEDFGEARLGRDGRVTVKLDGEFASLIDASAYQVFLTPYAPVSLYVAKRTRTSFEIRALPGATVPASAACGWRIVGRRKDVKAPRLAKVKIDAAPQAPDASVLRGVGKVEVPGKVAMEALQPLRRAARAVPQPPEFRKDLPTEPPETDG
jgi:hypothetical protein